MPYYVTMPDLARAYQGGAVWAQNERENQRLQMDRDEVARKEEVERKKAEFAAKVAAQRQGYVEAQTPEMAETRLGELAATAPEEAASLQKLVEEQRGLRAKQELDAATVWQPILEGLGDNPTMLDMQTAQQKLEEARAQGVMVDPGMLFQVAHPARRAAFLEATRQTIDRLSPKAKPEAPFRPGASVLDQARIFSTLAAERGEEVDPNILFGARGPSYAMSVNPELWAEAGALLEKQKASTAGRTVINNLPPGSAPGFVTPQKTVQAALENKIIMYEDVLAKAEEQLKTIGEADADKYFGLEGDIKKLGSKALNYVLGDMAPEAAKKYTDGLQEIRSFGTMLTYDFLVALSGKAVTDAERRTIIKAVGDPETMTLAEYRSAMRAMKKLSRAAVDSAKLQRELGLDVRVTDEQREKANEEMLSLGAQLEAGTLKPEQFAAALSQAKLRYNVHSTLEQYKNVTGDKKWTGEADKAAALRVIMSDLKADRIDAATAKARRDALDEE